LRRYNKPMKKSPKKKFSGDDAYTLTFLSGGIALMVMLAVWISSGSISSTDVTRVIAAGGDNGYSGNCRGNTEPGCGGGLYPPTVQTYNAVAVTSTTARLIGEVAGRLTQQSFRYGTNPTANCQDLGTVVNAVLADGDAGSATYIHDLTNLQPNTTYYQCIYASNSAGGANGYVLSFKTLPAPIRAPEVMTTDETNVTKTSATFNGKVDPNGSATTYYFRYGTTNPGSCKSLPSVTPNVGAGSGDSLVDKSVTVATLKEGTRYYYCIVGTNAGGTDYGNLGSLRTTPRAPQPITSITANSQTGVVRVEQGSKVQIHATFAPGNSFDVLVATAIDGISPYSYGLEPAGYNWVGVPGVASTPPRSVVPYEFNAQQTGDFTFIPSMKTRDWPQWDDYGKWVTVHVVCTSSSCTCPSGNSLVNGVCTPGGCPAGQHFVGSVCVPNATTCAAGFHLVGGVCVANSVTDICLNMPGNQSIVPTNCILQAIPAGTDCVGKDAGYRVIGTQCLKRGVISSFTATPERLRAGESTKLTWVVAGMNTCSITASSGAEPGVVSATNGSHELQNIHVDQITTYRLTCSDGVETFVSEKTVTVVPVFEEI
jgi:hypothetical protein